MMRMATVKEQESVINHLSREEGGAADEYLLEAARNVVAVAALLFPSTPG